MSDHEKLVSKLKRLMDEAQFELPTYITTHTTGAGPDVRTFALLAHGDPEDEALTGIIDEEEIVLDLSPRLQLISFLLNEIAPAFLEIAEGQAQPLAGHGTKPA